MAAQVTFTVTRSGFVTNPLLCVILVLTGAPRPGECQTAQKYQRLSDQFNQKLGDLANWCEQHQLSTEAAQTRQLVVSRDPNRQYFFIPEELNPWYDSRGSDDVQQWAKAFRVLRTDHAAALFQLVPEALAAGEGFLAYGCLHEITAVDVENIEARRVLGYRQANDRWLLSTVPTTSKDARSRQSLMGWPANEYLSIESPHYQIASRTSQEESVHLAGQLERWRIVWRQAFFDYWSSSEALKEIVDGKTPTSATRKHKVIFFGNRDQYIQGLQQLGVVGVETSTGFYSDRHQSLFLYLDDPRPEGTWMHEQAHQLFQESASARKDPVERSHTWALEGIAMYFESLVDRGHYATLGGFDHSRLQYARINWTREGFFEPFDALTRLGREAFQRDPNVGKLYSQSAAMAHFLMSDSKGKYRTAMLQLIELMYQRRAKLDSLEKLCAVPLAQLESEYQQFLTVDLDNVKTFLSDANRRTELALGFSNVDSTLGPLIGQCEQLRWLQLSRTAVDDEIGPALGKLKKLEQLFLDRTQVSDKIVTHLVGLPQLEELDLADAKVTDEGMGTIAKMTGLKALWLGGTQITDRGLEQLASLQQLQLLDVQRTQVSPEGLRRLKQRMPQLK